MKSELYYYNSASNRDLINLCSKYTGNISGEKIRYLLLPDRKMSFVKILELPHSPENNIRDMVKFQINKIYPGKIEDISFDFISFKSAKGWKIVLYILIDKYLDIIRGEQYFEGIILPLQLLSKKELHEFSHFIFYYPDMVELWVFKDGIPDKVQRHNTEKFSIEKSISVKALSILPSSQKLQLDISGRTKSLSKALISVRKNKIYFPEYRVNNKDSITIFVTIVAFMFSLALLTLISLKNIELEKEEKIINIQSETILQETSLNKEKLLRIEQLNMDLNQVYKSIPINVYNLLLRAEKAIDSNTTVMSFSFNGNELSLSLRNQNALGNLEGIKNEFGNVRASNIRTLEDGSNNYTVQVKIEQ